MEASRRNQIVLSLGKNDEIAISLRTHENASDSPGKTEPLVLFRLSLSELKGASPRNAAIALGGRVLATFVHLGEEGLGYVGYGVISEHEDAASDRRILERVAADDATALYDIALDKMFESVNRRDPQCLEAAEHYLRRSSEKGCDRAKDFLERVWPIEKEERIRIIERILRER